MLYSIMYSAYFASGVHFVLIMWNSIVLQVRTILNSSLLREVSVTVHYSIITSLLYSHYSILFILISRLSLASGMYVCMHFKIIFILFFSLPYIFFICISTNHYFSISIMPSTFINWNFTVRKNCFFLHLLFIYLYEFWLMVIYSVDISPQFPCVLYLNNNILDILLFFTFL